MAKTFTAQVGAWAAKTKRQMDAIVKTAVQDVVGDMQKPKAKGGNMPVDTGFLRNSISTTLDGSTPRGTAGGAEGYILAIAGYETGDTILVGYTANYAVHQEYGTRYLRGNAFRARAVRKWPQFVAKAAKRAEAIQ